ncbi:MAG: FAD-binding protein [Treponema sp.]|nr:FAD-binding protein [Treponema sp.]
MKKMIVTFAVFACVFLLATCHSMGRRVTDGVFEGASIGFGGELRLSVTITNGEIADVVLISDRESYAVMSRTFPLLRQRIMEARSPVVDSVTGATITSFAVKAAVADASRQAGIDVGPITFATRGPAPAQLARPPVQTGIVVVGGGPAGLAAAIEARQSGAEDIILIEKLDVLGGSGKHNMNFSEIINSQAQLANGRSEPLETFMAHIAGREIVPERIPVWAQGAAEADAWLRGIGVQLNYNWGRFNLKAEADVYAGDHMMSGMEAELRRLGVDIRTGTKGIDLIMEGGAVTGVVVEDRHGRYNIMAGAVILATGGFAANRELLARHMPGTEALATTNPRHAVGHFIPLFEEYGFWMERMNGLVMSAPVLSVNRTLTGSIGASPGFIYVNENGERFVSETTGGLTLAHRFREQPNGRVFYIYDQNMFDEDYAGSRRLVGQYRAGYHVSAATLEELAARLGINGANLAAAVEAFNRAVDGYSSDPFRATAFTRRFGERGPFYGVQVTSAVHMTRGGVVPDERARVLMADGSVVRGLFAAGEVTATLGNFSAAVIFGRVAGREAAFSIAQ